MDARADRREHGQQPRPGWEEISRVLVDVVRTAVAGAPDALTPVQLRCLEVLAADGGRVRVGDLAAALGVVASSASRLVDRLVALGLVTRRQAPASRREVEVALTAAGRRTLQRAADAVDGAMDAVTARMRPEDRRALHRGLVAMTETTQQETARDETARDETARDETARDETARDETAQDETARDETAQDETAQEETVRDDVVPEGATGDGRRAGSADTMGR